VKDSSTVRIHDTINPGCPPALPPLNPSPTNVGDSGKVRMGMFTPPFPANPAK